MSAAPTASVDTARVAAWADCARLLCVRLDSVGDVLMTEPALRALRGQRPGRRITLLTSAAGAATAALLDCVDDVIVFDAPWMKATDGPTADADLIRRLSGGGFDGAVIFNVWSQNPLPAAYLAYLAGIPLRLAHSRENAYGLLTDRVPDPEPHQVVRHEVRRQLDLVATVGARTDDERMRLSVPPAARETVRALLARAPGPAGAPLVLVHPGATAPSRRWPPERFAQAAARLVRAGCRVAFTGSGDEETALVARIRRAMGDAPSASLAGRLDLAGLAAAIDAADLLLVNNTGPAHLAAALGTPVAGLYALTNPQHTPWRVDSRVLYQDVPCRNCYRSVCPEGHHACLQGVGVDEVVAAALSLLGLSEPGGTASAAIRPAVRRVAPPASTRPRSPFETDALPVPAPPRHDADGQRRASAQAE